VPVRRGRPHRPGSVGSGKSGWTSRPAGSRTWCAGRSRSAAGTGRWPPACGIFAGTWSGWDTTGTASGASRSEAGCRTFGPRLKRPGTRWSQRGDSAMLPPKGCVMDLRLPDPLDWRAIQALAARPKNLGYTLDTLRADRVTVRCVSLRVPGPRSRRRPCGTRRGRDPLGGPRGEGGIHAIHPEIHRGGAGVVPWGEWNAPGNRLACSDAGATTRHATRAGMPFT